MLGSVAAIVGLFAARLALGWLNAVLEADTGQPLPFWFHSSRRSRPVAYAALLTVLGAVIAGVIPALKVTRGLAARIRQATAGAETFAPRLRAIAAALDPSLRLHEVQRLDKAGASLWLESQFLYR